MTSLTELDHKYWGPVPEVDAYLKNRFFGGRVLDVGPGHSPLPWATDAVDFVDVPGLPNHVKFTKCDLTCEPLPFPDKAFDFVYCRHLLEDSWNPFPICAEMSRVGRAGYVETPSPIAELCRGVDGSSPPYRGYHHHRFIVWDHLGELHFVNKYPLVEYLRFDEGWMAFGLRYDAKYWNTYHLWTDVIRTRHIQSPLDFNVGENYGAVLNEALQRSKHATDEFWTLIGCGAPKPSRQPYVMALPKILTVN